MQVSSSNQTILVNGQRFFFYFFNNLVRNYTNIPRDSNRVSPMAVARPMHLVDRLVRLRQSPTHHNFTNLEAKCDI